jgi:hypothetical protein
LPVKVVVITEEEASKPMKRMSFFFAVLAAGLLAASSVHAQLPPEWANAPTKNLKVLPKEQFKTNADVIGPMVVWRDALGVECVYCHTYVEPFHPKNDEAADSKPTKDKTRAMVRMLAQINATISTEIPPLDRPATDRKAIAVQCVTCHKGVPIPRQLIDILMDTGNTKGAASAVEQYRTLREKYYGGDQYDFTDLTLFLAAQRANGANKPEDAILYAQTNLEFNPKSARSYNVMSQAFVKKMDTANAISALEKAVALDPSNKLWQTQLGRLKNPPTK